MAEVSAGEVLACRTTPETWYWFRSRCGSDRDCVSDDRSNPFRVGYCGAVIWCRKTPGAGRFVDVYDPTNTYKLFRMTERGATSGKLAKCEAFAKSGKPSSFTYGDDPNPYTVQVPGILDILKVPGADSPELRRQRAQRFRDSNSGMPEGLKWVPKLLNKLDDAQDLLYTGLVLGVALLKRFGLRMIPGLGILLTVNDLLNAFG